MLIKKVYIWILYILLAGLFVLNHSILQSEGLGIVITLVYIGSFGYLVGYLLFSKREHLEKLILGSFIYSALLVVISAFTYLLVGLSYPIPLILLALIPLPLLYYAKDVHLDSVHFQSNAKYLTSALFFIIYLIGVGLLFGLLTNAATLEAVRSPWDILGSSYLFYFFVLTLLWLLFLSYNCITSLTIISSTVHSFLLLSIGIILFPLGFGFDPFLHQAAENIIVEHGVLAPKTIYYSGHYSLVVLLSYLSTIKVAVIDTLLVPILFALYIPSFAFYALRDYLGWQKRALVFIPAFVLLFPLTQFILSTPQGFSYIFLIATIFWWLIYSRHEHTKTLSVLILLIGSTLLIHPLSGMPLAIWFGILIVDEYIITRTLFKNKRLLLVTLLLIASLIVPMTFLINNLASNTLTTSLRLPSFSELGFTNLWHIETLGFITQYNSFIDLLYLYRFNWTLVYLILIVIGITLLKKNTMPRMRHLILGFAITWFSSIVLTLFFTFSELISYEQNDFASRLFLTSLYFILPLVFVVLATFWNRIDKDRYSQALFIVLMGIMITSVQFVSYPRYDGYERVRSFTTSIHDINAVNKIHTLASSKPYIVLANQSVSAAAVQELGFYKYYNDHFFYPLPTGGPLYDQYLAMVYDAPTREHAKTAADLTGVSTVYFVVNDYWFDSEAIKQAATLTADTIDYIGGENVTIFTYAFE
jgi:hypothetical protein